MKYFYLFFLGIFFSSCSKEELHTPFKLKNGQEVELVVGHHYAATSDPLMILPQNEPIELSVHGFPERKPGYIYHIKATLFVDPNPPQDGSDSWFNLTQVISEVKYQGNEPFEINLISQFVPGGSVISMGKIDGQYQFIKDKLELTYTSDAVKDQLEEIWQNALEIRENYEKNRQLNNPKWRSIRATVTHDPAKFGKAYLVQRIEFLK